MLMAYPSEKTRVILLVDDDADDRSMFCDALHEVDDSVECITAQDGVEALGILRTKAGALPDFIFLDLNMPRLNGQQCLREIRQALHLEHIPVIIYTTSRQQRDIDETKRLGAAGFITKPNTFDGICRSIASVLTNPDAGPRPFLTTCRRSVLLSGFFPVS